jgi:predicted transglutaminase-like cysteine proteinase
MKLFFAIALAAVSAAEAKADALSEATAPVRTAAFIQEFDNALAPLQFVKFCMNYSAECHADAGPRALPPTDRAMATLREVNIAVNRAIAPMLKPTDPIKAHWTVSPSAGDCNDYAVTKRHQLLALGWPSSALRLAVVLTAENQGHLVLVVRLPDGDVVLDNLSPKIRHWNTVGYEWISMQSGENPRFWVAIGRHGQRLRARRLAASVL